MSATLTAIKTDLRSAWRTLFRDEIAELRASGADHETRLSAMESREGKLFPATVLDQIADFNQRLIALETKPQPVAPPKDEENDPARGWQRQRDRAEEGERKRAS